MEKKEIYSIGEHTIEIRLSSTGSLSPWHFDYFDEHNFHDFFVTSDMCFFLKDNTTIYRFKYNCPIENVRNYLKTLEQLKEELKAEYSDSLINSEIDDRLNDLYDNYFDIVEETPEEIAMLRLRHEIEKLIEKTHNYNKPHKEISLLLNHLAEKYK